MNRAPTPSSRGGGFPRSVHAGEVLESQSACPVSGTAQFFSHRQNMVKAITTIATTAGAILIGLWMFGPVTGAAAYGLVSLTGIVAILFIGLALEAQDGEGI
jgi:hypothetical protein